MWKNSSQLYRPVGRVGIEIDPLVELFGAVVRQRPLRIRRVRRSRSRMSRSGVSCRYRFSESVIQRRIRIEQSLDAVSRQLLQARAGVRMVEAGELIPETGGREGRRPDNDGWRRLVRQDVAETGELIVADRYARHAAIDDLVVHGLLIVRRVDRVRRQRRRRRRHERREPGRLPREESYRQRRVGKRFHEVGPLVIDVKERRQLVADGRTDGRIARAHWRRRHRGAYGRRCQNHPCPARDRHRSASASRTTAPNR